MGDEEAEAGLAGSGPGTPSALQAATVSPTSRQRAADENEPIATSLSRATTVPLAGRGFG